MMSSAFVTLVKQSSKMDTGIGVDLGTYIICAKLRR